MLNEDFLIEFKRITEAKWRAAKINPAVYGFQFQQGTRWNEGLTDDLIAEYQSVLEVSFPDDLKACLRVLNGTDVPTLNTFGKRISGGLRLASCLHCDPARMLE